MFNQVNGLSVSKYPSYNIIILSSEHCIQYLQCCVGSLAHHTMLTITVDQIKNIMRSFLPVCFLLVTLSSSSQTVNKTISGQVKDIKNEPVAGAVIKLLHAKDSTVVQTIISRDNGKFVFNGLANGTFMLNIAATGNNKYVSGSLTVNDQRTVVQLPVIVLLPANPTALKEIIITSKKPLLEHDIDKTIVNVEAIISSATSNALEVLEKTPGITIDRSGDISLNGRPGAMVIIDGRQTYMSATDLAAYLRSIPGSTLDKIELMSNPPAKYDAAGTAVINIRLKKNRVQGCTGSLALSYQQGIKNSSYNSLNMNYLDKKVNVFGNISFNNDQNFDEDSTQRIFYTAVDEKISSAALYNYYTYHVKDVTLRTGMDYAVSSKTTIGFITSFYSRNKTDNMNYHNNSFSTDDTNPDSSGYGNAASSSQWRQVTANINLQHKFNTSGRELTADINYVHYTNTAKRLLDNFIVVHNADDSNYIFQYDLPSNINIGTFKADYAHPLKNKTMLSAGIKSSFVQNDNAVGYSDIINSSYQPDLSKSNHFIYKENINALYINARKDWRQLGVQLGLRLENTNTKGEQLGNDVVPPSVNTNHYTGLFPSVFVSYKLDSTGKNILSLNMSRRISRPNYQQLNPFLVFIDQYAYSIGNPYLRPSYNNNVELSYRYKQFANISFQYNGISDAYFNATRSVNTIFITKPENTDGRYMMALFVNLNFPVTKWWKLNLNIGGANFVTKGTVYGQSLDQNRYAYRFNVLSQFVFSKDWSAEISGRYTSSTIQLQRIYQPRYQVNAGIQKKILKGKGSLKLNVEDIFYTLQYKDRITGIQLTDTYHINVQDTRRIGIAANFNIGKETFARKRRYNDNSTDDVKGRVD